VEPRRDGFIPFVADSVSLTLSGGTDGKGGVDDDTDGEAADVAAWAMDNNDKEDEVDVEGDVVWGFCNISPAITDNCGVNKGWLEGAFEFNKRLDPELSATESMVFCDWLVLLVTGSVIWEEIFVFELDCQHSKFKILQHCPKRVLNFPRKHALSK